MINLQKQIIDFFGTHNLKYKDYNQLFLFLSKELNEKSENIAKCINRMISEGILIENSRRQLVVSKEFGFKKGIVCGNSKGFAFIKPITNLGKISKREIDFFVPASKMLGALDGDTVLFREEADKCATIMKILKRRNNYLIGKVVSGEKITFNRKLDKEGMYVVPNNDKFCKPIFVSKKEMKGANEGDRVEVELTFQPEGAKGGLPIGRIKRVLIEDDIENGISSILCDNQIPEEFPESVLKEAESLSTNYLKEKKNRIDLTNKLIVTIDGEDAKDFDDAISIEKDGEGYLLGVHIADVGEYVKYGSELDKEAFIRGTSVYFPDRVFPMLPERLSNNLCSLRPNEDKLALTVEMNLDKFGNVKSYKIFESVIKSSARLTYTQAYDVIKKFKGDTTESKLNPNFPEIKDGNIKKAIILMDELSQKIGIIREKEGMLDFNIPETYFDMQGKNIIDVRKRERNQAHKLIENFMILCNQVVAKHFCLLEVPFVYRVHEKPAKQRIDEAIEVLNSFGLNIKDTKKVSPKFIQEILYKLKGKDYEDIGNKILLRSLEKAMYLEDCLGHFGLALEYYCHFTSPIRRYPDLSIHRIIKRVCKLSLNNVATYEQLNSSELKKIFVKDYDLQEFVVDSSLQSSDRELKADEAERDVDDLFKAKFMQDKIGQEFEGKISSVNNFGIFVELPNTIEGLIKIENLPADDYKYDEKKLVLKGRTRKFTIGDEIKIVVINVNLTTRKIEFQLK